MKRCEIKALHEDSSMGRQVMTGADAALLGPWTPSSHITHAAFEEEIFVLLRLVCLFVLIFWNRVSLCSPGYPGTHSVDQVGFELRNLPASASHMLGLKACATTTWLPVLFVFWFFVLSCPNQCPITQSPLYRVPPSMSPFLLLSIPLSIHL